MNGELQLAFTAAAAVPVIIGIVAALKQARLPSRYAMLAAVALGPILGVVWALAGEFDRQTVMAYVLTGIGAGVTASRTYDALPEPVQSRL